MKKLVKKCLGENLLLPISLLLVALFLLLDSFNLLPHLRHGISFLFTPVAVDATNTGGGIREFASSVTNVSKFRKEYNEMKVQMYEKDINNAYYQTLLEENNSLRKQINLSNVVEKQVLTKVVGSDGLNKLNIDAGSKDGVSQGDIVSLGNLYIGVVDKVDAYGSSVSLPSSKDSSFEVIISTVGVEQGKVVESAPILSKAVATGIGEHISLENIAMNSSVKDGDIVITNDSKVGRYLVVGKVVGLSNNPAATSKSAKVSPLVEYEHLMTVFVTIK